ncbi:hypothetical protein QBZ16_002498 [Prototheca wickerhamii]|uniref:Uncharacterized protein n=1 Tax=Prototheca wickerhamii TaxID=3111 RepID=A0AAD9MJM1_PROWI|nr:hypothetical protein QBZ16_002498 [Prototheca wickerhamii]
MGSDSSGTDSEGENNAANGTAEPGRESGDDIEAFRLRQRWLDGAGLQPGASAEDVAQAQLAYIERLEKENARYVVQKWKDLKARLEQIEGHVQAWRRQESATKETAAADSTSTNGSTGSREPLGMSAAAPGG